MLRPQYMQVTYTPGNPQLFWSLEKPEDPQIEPHAGIKMAQGQGLVSLVYICDFTRHIIQSITLWIHFNCDQLILLAIATISSYHTFWNGLHCSFTCFVFVFVCLFFTFNYKFPLIKIVDFIQILPELVHLVRTIQVFPSPVSPGKYSQQLQVPVQQKA